MNIVLAAVEALLRDDDVQGLVARLDDGVVDADGALDFPQRLLVDGPLLADGVYLVLHVVTLHVDEVDVLLGQFILLLPLLQDVLHTVQLGLQLPAGELVV